MFLILKELSFLKNWFVTIVSKRKASGEDESSRKRQWGSKTKASPEAVKRKERDEALNKVVIGSKSRADFHDKYQLLDLLGEGGFSSVFAGRRKSDLLPVAIKCMQKQKVKIGTFELNGQSHQIPLEVLFMLRAAGPEGSEGKSAVVQVKDWYDLDNKVFVVMERPFPSVDLYQYLEDNTGQLDEDMAKIIMKQLVEAVIDINAKQMFHRDLKLENILIQTTSDGPRVRIIDFGCGCFTGEGPYYTFSGTQQYIPPEVFLTGYYEAIPTTVWQLGGVLFDLVQGSQFDTRAFIHSELKMNDQLSKECQDLLKMCLDESPDKRATLEQIRQHPWLS